MAITQSLLVFGPQTTWPSAMQLDSLRTFLLHCDSAKSLLLAIRSLDIFCDKLYSSFDELRNLHCSEVASIYQQWLNGEPLDNLGSPPPNSLITSLTVLLHLLQYLKSLDQNQLQASHDQVLKSTAQYGIQGFCSGLLAAVAVSSSKKTSDLCEAGPKAFRLAFAIGALVDLDAKVNPKGPAACIAVRWRSEEARKTLFETLEKEPGAYVSVLADSSCVSITAPRNRVEDLCHKLSVPGMSAKGIEVHGRFHNADHEKAAQRLKNFCITTEDVRFAPESTLCSPLWSNIDASPVHGGLLHELVIDSMLSKQSRWYNAFIAAVGSRLSVETPLNVTTLGTVDAVPSSLTRQQVLRNKPLADLQTPPQPAYHGETIAEGKTFADETIAIVGMSCKFPGADSVTEFWELINYGLTMVDEVADNRFSTKGLRRTADGKTPFWGCFVRDSDAFDHEFFKKSPREATSMDPKQRMLLEEAYHAMESTGQWSMGDTQGEDIGCYVGVATDDYYDNVNSHAPNAFSATGTLRAFLSGKISHFFGWTGPSITLDTACSGSLVAIHAACKAILDGECSRAIAGGVNSISSPNMYQNLAAATFLSKTGICKPFDAKADGYCRGEGVGLVVLKKYSQAIADQDKILAVIKASATNQNNNETAITVPHTGSQKDLYRKILAMSDTRPETVSYVEAHGTGTPVGDPREVSSIREVFGSATRPDKLHIGSVKGNIGHLEAASGVASLIKTVLMMQHQTIPPASSFSTLNPKIPALEPDRMAIATASGSWKPRSEVRIACINNYGASGNNAAMLITQGADRISEVPQKALASYPIFISGYNEDALQRNCASIANLIRKFSPSLPDVAYELHRTQSRLLPHASLSKVSSIEEFVQSLDHKVMQMQRIGKPKPVVLAFGGQSSMMVGLDKEIFDRVTILRSHITLCDEILRTAGLEGVIPAIFQKEPIENLVTLHACFFTIQYATAMTWIDTGLPVQGLVGHSFGQLTALSVSGWLSLQDGLKYVTGRAAIMQACWGPIRGAMISVEASTELSEVLVSTVKQSGPGRHIEIACYNSPTSHTLVGTPTAVDAVVEIVSTRPEKFAGVKTKKLSVTHGFHSIFTEELLPQIDALARTLKPRKSPDIYLETSTSESTWSNLNSSRFAEHTRTPVFFGKAVDRLVDRLGPCIWVEAGTGSSITGIVKRAVGTSQSPLHSYETVNLHRPESISSLVDVTVKLWQNGYKVKFWPFHPKQSNEYSAVDLPPYQFKKSRHWMPYVDSLSPSAALSEPKKAQNSPLVQFSRYLDDRKELAEFTVDKLNAQFQLSVKGHAVLDQPLCPAGEYIEIVVQAALLMDSITDAETVIWSLENLSIVAPLGLSSETPLKANLKRTSAGKSSFEFQLLSEAKQGVTKKPTVHGSGVIHLRPADDRETKRDMMRASRLVDVKRYHSIVNDDTAESLRGSLLYKLFAKVVTYADFYMGLKSVTATEDDVASKVMLPDHSIEAVNRSTVNTLAIDNFLQVAGINVNCLRQGADGDGEVYVCTHVERLQPGPAFMKTTSNSWLIYSNFSRSTDKESNNDIYVFDSRTDELVMVILGVCFTKVAITALARTIARANPQAEPAAVRESTKADARAELTRPTKTLKPASSALSTGTSTPACTDSFAAVTKLINQITGVPLDIMKSDTCLEHTGIDSLMVHELHEEIRTVFNVELPSSDLGSMTISKLAEAVRSRGDSEPASLVSTPAETPSPSIMSRSSSVSVSTRTPPSSISEGVMGRSTALSKLAKFVADQLGTTTTMTRETCLGDCGMDSLMSLELANDIEEAFGVHIDHGYLTAETTFGQLADKVVPAKVPVSTLEVEEPKVNNPLKSIRAKPATPPRRGKIDFQTVMWKECEDSTKLSADIYLPNCADTSVKDMPVALMIHGGGHTMLSRKDLRTPQTQYLLDNGFLPVSIDYRLSPEINIRDGAMQDISSALEWVREGLPNVAFKIPGLTVNASKVIVVGWSTGGTLSMTLPFTSLQRGIKPPNAILAFYCPTDYEAEHWYRPNYPENSFAVASKQTSYDLLQGVAEKPITEYNIPKDKANVGGWMNLEDPRSRIVLHMNWKGQAPAVLLSGLPSKEKCHKDGLDEASFFDLPTPKLEDVVSISPASQIRRGNYRVPTFLIHGTKDDLIPWQQTQQTFEDLRAQKVPADVRILKDRVHLFDIYRDNNDNEGWKTVRDGYDFLFEHAA